MRTNAVIRIVIWSIIILVLTSVLLFFLGIQVGVIPDIPIASSTVQTIEPQPEVQTPITVTVQEELNLRKMPSSTSEAAATLAPGTVLEVLRTENINGILWGFVKEPGDGGWINMQYVTIQDPLSGTERPSDAAATTPAVPNGAASVPAGNIREISIEWAAGTITVCRTEGGDQILFFEEGGDSDHPMTWHQKEGKLDIDFSQEQFHIGIGINSFSKKDLTIQVPRDFSLEDLEIDAGSAKIFVQDMTIQEVDLDTASGKASFQNCTVETMEVDTASGDIQFTGSLTALDCDAASADFTATLNNVPRKMEMDSASGSLKLTLPKTAGFSVKVDGMSSKFSSDFETTLKSGRYVHGDGSCRIDMDAMSGNVTIKKGQ